MLPKIIVSILGILFIAKLKEAIANNEKLMTFNVGEGIKNKRAKNGYKSCKSKVLKNISNLYNLSLFILVVCLI